MKIVLITSAIQEELSGLEKINQKKIKNYKFYLYSLGIGKINALLKLIEIFNKKFYKENLEIIFLGSGGSYGALVHPFIYSNLFINYDLGSLKNKSKNLESISYLIKTNMGSISKGFIKKNPEMLQGIVNSTDSITLSPITKMHFYKINPNLKELKIPIVENLELYGIAKFCMIYNIPLSAFLSITNKVGKTASEDWKKNYKTLAVKFNKLLKNYLESI
ncbi:MAG: hypothetical protein ACK4UJ_04785 [Leptonema sp. (in: bacteria)]